MGSAVGRACEVLFAIPAVFEGAPQSGAALLTGGEAGVQAGRKEVGRMSKRGSGKVTSAKVAKQASSALRDGRSSSRTKSIAASALAQAKGGKKGK